MKPNLLKAAALGASAIALAAMASPTVAKTLTYTFATSDGTAYCDGITVTSGAKSTWSGNHTGSCTAGDAAGGFTAAIGKGSYVEIATTDSTNAPGLVLTYLLDTKAKAWYLYGNSGSGFALFNEGSLIKGAPAIPAKGHGARASAFKNPKAVDKLFF